MKKCEKCGHEIKENVIQNIPAQKLEWGKVSKEEMTWDEAVAWCKAQGEGWRLPTRVELIRAFDEKVDGFSGNYFWSSTENYNVVADAWSVSFYSGDTYSSTKVTSYYVRCVRL